MASSYAAMFASVRVPPRLVTPTVRRATVTPNRVARTETRRAVNFDEPEIAPPPPTPTSTTHSVFACPTCGASTRRFSYDAGACSVRCNAGHTVDVAKEGHVNLLAAQSQRGGRKKSATGDTAAMVAARGRFLDNGHYLNAGEAVAGGVVRYLMGVLGGKDDGDADADTEVSPPEFDTGATSYENTSQNTSTQKPSARAKRLAANVAKSQVVKQRNARARSVTQSAIDLELLKRKAPVVVDFGCGDGWWLERIVDRLNQSSTHANCLVNFAGLDASPAASKAASRRLQGNAQVAVGDAQRDLPFATASVDVGLSIFAPRNVEELSRVLKPNGIVVVASPNETHLNELREMSTKGQLDGCTFLNAASNKKAKVTEQMTKDGWFQEVECVEVTQVMRLTKNDVADILGMGPSAFHAKNETEKEKENENENENERNDDSVFGAGGANRVDVTNAFVIQTFRRKQPASSVVPLSDSE